METLLLLIIVCTLILTAMGCLSTVAGACLIGAAAVWFVIQIRQSVTQKNALVRRRTELRAKWGFLVRHLNGLPLPVDTPASLFFSEQGFTLETENEVWTVAGNHINRILLATSDQIKRMNDQQLCRLLHVNSRIFYALREKIRRHDSHVRRGSILMITYQNQLNEPHIWILISSVRPNQLMRLIEISKLSRQTVYRLPSRYTKSKQTKKAED